MFPRDRRSEIPSRSTTGLRPWRSTSGTNSAMGTGYPNACSPSVLRSTTLWLFRIWAITKGPELRGVNLESTPRLSFRQTLSPTFQVRG